MHMHKNHMKRFHGIVVMINLAGPRYEVSSFKDGNIHGLFMQCSAEGNIYTKAEYMNGELQGECIFSFEQNGQV